MTERLAWVYLGAAAVWAPLLVLASPFPGWTDPSVVGACAFFATVASTVALRAGLGAGSRAERSLYTAFLLGMPVVYLAGAGAAGASATWWAAELLGLVGFGALAAIGLTGRAGALGLGIASHGMLWDAWHHGHADHVAPWYPILCLHVDVAVGLYAWTQADAWNGPPDGAYWRRHAARYDRATLGLCRSFPEVARAVADRTRGLDVLEVAAGTGLVTAVAAPAARSWVATDLSPEMLAVLRERVGGAVETRVDDAMALRAADASVDVVVVANLLHLLPDPRAALGEAHRVLRPGGRLVAPTFCHAAGPLARATSTLLAATGFPIATRFRGPDLDELIGSAGFAVEEARWFPGLLPIRAVVATRA